MTLFNRILGYLYGKSRQYYYERRYSEYRKLYGLPSSVGFNGTDIRIYGKGNLTIEENSYLGSLSTIELNEGNTVQIGKNCQISHNVRIYTSSAIPDQDFNLNEPKQRKSGDVSIGNGVWIGANVFINPNVKIGDNVVVGSNSVVTKDVEPFSIIGGVPATLIRAKKIEK